MNACLAGYFGVPVVLVVGDTQTCREAKDFLGDVVCVATKEGIDRFAAKLYHPEDTREAIRRGAKEALSRLCSFKPRTAPSPACLDVDFTGATMAMICSFIPGVERIGPRTIRYEHSDYRTVYNLLLVFQILARSPMAKDAAF
jgi:D-amino peptidase